MHKTFNNSESINNISIMDQNINNFENKEHLEQLQQRILNNLTTNEKKVCVMLFSSNRYTILEISCLLDCSTQYVNRLKKQILKKVKELDIKI
jgi:DNA-directed RNA polymerase specialized sigma subunit